MRFLIDEDMPRSTDGVLKAAGHEVSDVAPKKHERWLEWSGKRVGDR